MLWPSFPLPVLVTFKPVTPGPSALPRSIRISIFGRPNTTGQWDTLISLVPLTYLQYGSRLLVPFLALRCVDQLIQPSGCFGTTLSCLLFSYGCPSLPLVEKHQEFMPMTQSDVRVGFSAIPDFFWRHGVSFFLWGS